ncbi:MAG: hypothetical protein KAU41_03115, partial [Deltaproteobacteria bacterium]|nr:hypothetical protein [Deltaproteobacteria bacterium]
ALTSRSTAQTSRMFCYYKIRNHFSKLNANGYRSAALTSRSAALTRQLIAQLKFYKRGVQLGKIGRNLNHSEVIRLSIYHALMNDIRPKTT